MKLVSMSVVLSGVVGCAVPGLGGDADNALRFLLVPSPGQFTSTQALCADGTEARDAAQALVDELNEAVGADRALLEAVAEAAPQQQGGISVYQVEVDGRVMEVQVVTDGVNATYTGTIDGAPVLSGATANDATQGALELRDLSVAWDESEPGVIRVARSAPGSDAAVFIEPDRVRIAADGDGGERTAGWTAEAGVLLDGETVACWQGAEQCDTDCSPSLVQELSVSLDG